MATQAKYSFMANAFVAYAHQWIRTLSPIYQNFIPMDKIPAASGALAKYAVDEMEAYDAAHTPPPAPQPVSLPAAPKRSN